MKLNLELPINNLSLGQVSYGVLREIFSRQLLPNIFPIGNVDLSAYNLEKPFVDWLQYCINSAPLKFKRTTPTVKIWHLMGSEKRISDKTVLWTPHETDRFTPIEKNIIQNTDIALFTSSYSVENAKKSGLDNVDYCPNFFDDQHFSNIDGIIKPDAVTFSLIGKFEKRKHTAKILQLWAQKFGKNPKFRLNCLIHNHFIQQEAWPQIFGQVFGGPPPWNINFIPFQEKNSQVNLIMNACDIDISGLSGAEGFNLPCFHMLALNKLCIILDAHAHKDYCNKGSSILVPPSGKEPIYDGHFFVQNGPFNQGEMYSFDNDDVLEAFDIAVETINSKKEFPASNLRNEFSVKNTVDKLFSYIS